MDGKCGLHNNFPPGSDESKGKETKMDFYLADFDPDKWVTFKARWFFFPFSANVDVSPRL